MKSLGIDVGSSSVKISLLDIAGGKCIASSTNPSSEMPIKALQNGWAEQDPGMWWQYVCEGIRKIGAEHSLADVRCIGITYQMHGLVCLGKDGKPVRDAIIWCDSRAVGIGREAMQEIGHEKCLEHLLNSPGNFTASKLAWVIRNEKETFAKTEKFFLPGDYIAYMLSGDIHTTETGLSEQILWDFKEEKRADFVSGYYGIPSSLIPDTVPAIPGDTSRDTDIIQGRRPAEQRVLPERTRSGRNRRHRRDQRCGLRSDRYTGSRQAVKSEHIRPCQPQTRSSEIRHTPVYKRNRDHERLDQEKLLQQSRL